MEFFQTLSEYLQSTNVLWLVAAISIMFLFMLVRVRKIQSARITIKSHWDIFGIRMTNISKQLLATEIVNHLESSTKNIKTMFLADMQLLNAAYVSKPLHYMLSTTDLVIPAGHMTSLASRLCGSYGSQQKSIAKAFSVSANVAHEFSDNPCLLSNETNKVNYIKSSVFKDTGNNTLHTYVMDANNDLGSFKTFIKENDIDALICTALDANTLIDIRRISNECNIRLLIFSNYLRSFKEGKNYPISGLSAFIASIRVFKHWVASLVMPSTVEEREYLNPAAFTHSYTYAEDHKKRYFSKLFTKQWQSMVLFKFYLKRFFDLTISALALLLLGPLLLFTALAIRFESPGPIFFKQVRVGYKGKPFTMYKFRSMFIDAEERLKEIQKHNESDGGVLFKMKKDPRITRIGRIIRKLSIDELPQIINVFRGDMSIVGPRPALPSEVSKYQTTDRKRLQTKPGLTCLWQIGGRSDLSFEQQVELDVKYLSKKSLAEDIAIVVKTVPAVITGKGAY